MKKLLFSILAIVLCTCCDSKPTESERIDEIWDEAMTHLQQGVPLTEDTLLPKAIKYVRSHNDSARIIESYILEAQYHYWQENKDSAITVLDNGIAYAKENTDSISTILFLRAKAEMLGNYGDFKNAIATLEELLKKTDKTKSRLYYSSLYTIGLYRSLSGDNKYKYDMQKASDFAFAAGDTISAVHFLRNYADALTKSGDFKKSNDLIKRAAKLSPETWNHSSVLQITLAENYLNLRMNDSARIYLQIAEQNENKMRESSDSINSNFPENYSPIISRKFLNNILEYSGGNNISRHEISRYCDSIMLKSIERQNTIQQQLETNARLQQINYELKFERQRTETIIIISVLLLILSAVLVYFHIRNKYKRLAEAEERIDALTSMLQETQQSTTSTDEAHFKKLLLQQLGIIRLVANTPTAQNQELLRRISGISNNQIPVNGLLNWDDIYALIDKLYDNFYSRLIKTFGNTLNNKEIQICCLLCAKFSTKEIGVITQQSSATIYVRKTSIRKKIGADEGEDIISRLASI